MKISKNILLAIFSIFFTLIFIEIILELFFPQSKSGSWRIQDEDTGTYLNIKNERSQHQFLGKKEKIKVEYNFGSFHNRILQGQNSELKDKILILGDSHIFGWLLKDEETFVYQLQNEYKNKFLVNASAGGFSDIDSLNYMKKFCKLIHPKKILFFLEVDRSIASNLLKLDENSELIIKNVEINKVKKKINSYKFINYLIERLNFMQILRKAYINTNKKNLINFVDTGKLNKNLHIEIIKFMKLIEKINLESERCGSEIIYIDLGWVKKDSNSEIKNQVFKNLEMLNEKNLIKFFSLYNDLTKIRLNQNYYKLEEGHPNKLANNLFYLSISKNLKKFIN